MWPPAVLEAVVVFILSILVHRYYAPIFRHRWYVPLTVLPGFFFSFYILALVPTDVVSGDRDRCISSDNSTHQCAMPLLYISKDGLTVIWEILYWTTYVVCWTVYPLLQSYALAAGFTVFDKAFRAVVENVVFYGVIGALLGIVLLIYGLARGLEWDDLEAMAIAGSNVWGFMLVMLFFGYGLVAIPRLTWRYADYNSWFRYMCYEAVTFRDDMRQAKAELLENMHTVKVLDAACIPSHPLRSQLDMVIGSCPAAYEEMRAEHSVNHDGDITRGQLVKLKTKIKRNRNAYVRNLWMYERCLHRAFEILDIFDAKDGSDHSFAIRWSLSPPRSHTYRWTERCCNVTEYIWKLYVRTWFYRFIAMLCFMLSVTLLWSEVLLFTNQLDDMPDLSLWPRIISHLPGTFFTPWVLVVPLAYMCTCVYWSLFRFRLFEYYRLVPHHSQPASLFFAALYLCRLISPLVYNFLAVIGTTDTAFYSFMGKMDRVPLVGSINRYLPIALLLVVLATMFEVFTRASTWIRSTRASEWLHIRRFNFDSSWTNAQLEEGEELVRRKRAALGVHRDAGECVPSRSKEPMVGSSAFAQSLDGRRRADSLSRIAPSSATVPRRSPAMRVASRLKGAMRARSSSHMQLPSMNTPTSEWWRGEQSDVEMSSVLPRRAQSLEDISSPSAVVGDEQSKG